MRAKLHVFGRKEADLDLSLVTEEAVLSVLKKRRGKKHYSKVSPMVEETVLNQIFGKSEYGYHGYTARTVVEKVLAKCHNAVEVSLKGNRCGHGWLYMTNEEIATRKAKRKAENDAYEAAKQRKRELLKRAGMVFEKDEYDEDGEVPMVKQPYFNDTVSLTVDQLEALLNAAGM